MDELTFGFEIYAQHTRHYLYISAHPSDARVHLASEKVRGSGQTPSPLLLLLRKQVENAFIDSIIQLPHERVLKIQFDHSVEGLSTLIIETIGKYSNIILVDAGELVIDALKRVSSQVNRARVILPKHPYVPPVLAVYSVRSHKSCQYQSATQAAFAARTDGENSLHSP